jgi:hypothetical protein
MTLIFQQEICHESFYCTVWLQIRRLMGGTLMYERETDEATRKVVSCYHVNVCSSPHHSHHTPCISSLQYDQNLTPTINVILRNLYYKMFASSHKSYISYMSAILYCCTHLPSVGGVKIVPVVAVNINISIKNELSQWVQGQILHVVNWWQTGNCCLKFL